MVAPNALVPLEVPPSIPQTSSVSPVFSWLRSVPVGKATCTTPEVFGSFTFAPAVLPELSLTKFRIVAVKCTIFPLSLLPSLSRVATVVSVALALYAASVCAGDWVGACVGCAWVGACVGACVGWEFCCAAGCVGAGVAVLFWDGAAGVTALTIALVNTKIMITAAMMIWVRRDLVRYQVQVRLYQGRFGGGIIGGGAYC